MVGGSLRVLTFKTGRHDIAEILLKVALSTINQIKSNQIKYTLVMDTYCHTIMALCL
jgi:hypothetical protein